MRILEKRFIYLSAPAIGFNFSGAINLFSVCVHLGFYTYSQNTLYPTLYISFQNFENPNSDPLLSSQCILCFQLTPGFTLFFPYFCFPFVLLTCHNVGRLKCWVFYHTIQSAFNLSINLKVFANVGGSVFLYFQFCMPI